MADGQNTETKPHVLIQLGGTLAVVEENRTGINALLHGLKRKEAKYVFGFDGVQHRCHRAEAMLRSIGLPESHWNGVTFYAYSTGPGPHYGWNAIVGIGVKVQRQRGDWVLLDAYKAGLSAEESGDPHFQPFTAQQWEQIPDPDDDPNPRRRQSTIRFTK